MRVESIASRYWARRFNGARRIAPPTPAAGAGWLPVAGSVLPARSDAAPTLAERVFALPIIGADPAYAH